MKFSTLVVFLMLALFGFFIWNRASSEGFVDVSADKPVDPATIQTIVNNIQARIPDLYPLQTVYINPLQGDQGSGMYNARILFLNTRGYFGVQYDVQADADGNILSITGIAQPKNDSPFQSYNTWNKDVTDKYQDFDAIEAVLDQQFSDLKTKAPDVAQRLDTWLDIQRAQMMGRMQTDAQSNTMQAGSTSDNVQRAIVA